MRPLPEKTDFQKVRRRLLKAGVYLAPAILNLSDCLRYAWAQGGPRAQAPVDVPVDVRLGVEVPVEVPVRVPARIEARITIRPR